MYRKKVFELSNTSLLKSILCNKVFILLIALLIGFLLILFLSVRSIPNDQKTGENTNSIIGKLQSDLNEKNKELIEMSKKMIQFENQLNSLQKKLKRYRDSQSNKTPSIDDPFSDFYDLNLYHYQNPYFYHTEEDTRFIKYERYEDRPKISKTIVSDNEILYHLDFESFYLDTPNFLDQESYDMFCDERDKPSMAPGDCEKFVSSMTTPYFTTGNETFVKNFSFDKLPECLETTTMNSFQKPTSQNVKHFEKLALITPARSNYFQHWIDHALSPLMQARPFIKDKGYTILALRPADKNVDAFWNLVKKDFNVEIEFYQKNVRYDVDEFLMACSATIWNPQLIYESKIFLLKNILETDSDHQIRDYIPENVIYLPRVNNSNKREVLNSKEIENYLQMRFGDKFKIFYHQDFFDLKNLVDFFGSAKIIIGGHGGALYNLIFTLSHPIIIEFQTQIEIGSRPIFWWISHSTGSPYWRIYGEPIGINMNVPLYKLEQVLNQALNEDVHLLFNF